MRLMGGVTRTQGTGRESRQQLLSLLSFVRWLKPRV